MQISPSYLEGLCRTLLDAVARERLDGKLWVVEHGRIRVYEESEQYSVALDYALPSITSSTRAGVSGRNGTRTPMAFATAFEMAAPGETTGGSAKPMTPRSS